ncbi:TatD family hydrolase [Spirochaeta lutea]|uniref:TatD family hydrolase n=1 Tax=Spirochaeta lutea TaxID=1480694 RepID=UPI00068BBFF3|nr:TatD family hydrolase [Spirochaeta lutea]
MIIDSHFHSQEMKRKGMPVGALLEEAHSQGLAAAVDIATHIHDWGTRLKELSKYPFVFFSLGLYPSVAEEQDLEKTLEALESLLLSETAINPRLIAIGEIGLDFHWHYATPELQTELLVQQLELAQRFDLPVVIHNRNADKVLAEILKQHGPARGGIMHCYSSGPEWIDMFLDQGMYISFAGNLTFKKNNSLREACALVPPDRLLLETDAPYLAPEPKRGKANHPGQVAFTYEVAAEIRTMSKPDLESQIAKNFRTLFPGAWADPRSPESPG